MKTVYRRTINKLYDSIIWTHKIHRTYLEELELRQKVLSIVKIVLTSVSAILTAGFSFVNANITVVFAVLTIASLIVSEILDKVETERKISDFKQSSNNLFALRNRIGTFADEINGSKLNEGYIKQQISLFFELYALYVKDLPTIPNRIVKKASNKLKERKDEEVGAQIL